MKLENRIKKIQQLMEGEIMIQLVVNDDTIVIASASRLDQDLDLDPDEEGSNKIERNYPQIKKNYFG